MWEIETSHKRHTEANLTDCLESCLPPTLHVILIRNYISVGSTMELSK